MKTLILLTAMLGLAVPAFAADVEEVRKMAIGQWELDEPIVYEGKEYSRVKDVREKQETVSTYDKEGKLALQWRVDYEITVVNNIAVFTFWNLTGTYPEKGEPDQERHSYQFKIANKRWHEIHDLSVSSDTPPTYNTYTRIKVVVVPAAAQ